MRRDLLRLQGAEHDVLVVGGGIHGAAAAWDAAQRGLRVALVEAADFGAGASWNSLKTIHGGLRHLQRADLPGLRESVRERRAFLHIAPELVRPLPFLLPLRGHGLRGRAAVTAALLAFDLLSRDRNRGLPASHHIPRGRILGRAALAARVPGLEAAHAALWHDAQVESSERLVMGFLHAAAGAGAVVANAVEVAGVLRDGARVSGARVRDAETGEAFDVRARLVIAAAGAAAGAVASLAGISLDGPPLLEAMNLVLGRPVVTGTAVGGEAEGRLLFLVPWNGRAIVGTEYAGPGNAGPGWVPAFLARARKAFPWADLREGDVALVHRGRARGRGEHALITRHRVIDHRRAHGVPGLVSIVSAKFTTARAAAEEAVDLAFAQLGRPLVRSRTAVTALPAARPLAGDLAAQARSAARDEMALHLDDALRRRLGLGAAGPPSTADVETVAAALAAELGWSPERLHAEKAAFARHLAPPVPPA